MRARNTGHHQTYIKQKNSDIPHLDVRGQESVDIVDLGLEATTQHLISFIKHKHLDVASSEVASLDHVYVGGARKKRKGHTLMNE